MEGCLTLPLRGLVLTTDTWSACLLKNEWDSSHFQEKSKAESR
jgi:hypothetical protein